MMLQQIKDKLETFAKLPLPPSVRNIAIYKDKLCYIEFDYGDQQFAFDVTPVVPNENKGEQLQVTLVWRKKSFHLKAFLRKTEAIHPTLLTDYLIQSLKEVCDFIDTFGHIKCSVIVPVHNREELIIPLIKSLNNQTLDKSLFEVIFVDDASTDKTVETIKTYSQDIQFRIILRSTPSGNASAPRNDGIQIAKGRYILFIDSDDFISPSTLKNAINYAEQHDSDIVYLKIDSLDGRLLAVRPWKGKNNIPFASVYKNFLLLQFAPAKLFRTSLLRDNRIFFDRSLIKAEDALFLVSAIACAQIISMLRDESYIFLSAHTGSHLSQTKEENRWLQIYRLWSSMLCWTSLIEDQNKKREVYNVLLYRFVVSYYQSLISTDCNIHLRKIMKMFINSKELFTPDLIYKDHIREVLDALRFHIY